MSSQRKGSALEAKWTCTVPCAAAGCAEVYTGDHGFVQYLVLPIRRESGHHRSWQATTCSGWSRLGLWVWGARAARRLHVRLAVLVDILGLGLTSNR